MALNSRRTVAAIAAGTIATIAPIGALVTNTANAATSPARVTTTTTSTLRAWAEGTFRVGHDITIDASGHDAHGMVWDKATIIGPAGIKAHLTPAADAGHLTGNVHIPSHIRATWIRLTIIAPNGLTTHLVIHAPSAHKPVTHKSLAWSNAWAAGKYQAGKTVTVDADGFDARGVALDRAKVSGPFGIRGELTPAADAAHLTGEVFVPKGVTANVIHLRVTMSDGQHVNVTVPRH